MNSIILNKNEIDAINLFVRDITNNVIIEGILFYPELDKDGSFNLKVIVIRNIGLQYTVKALGTATIPKRAKRLKEIDSMVEDYNRCFNGKRLSFEITNIDDYNVVLMHENELKHMRTLFSSTILFDRFGDISERQNRQIKYITKCKYLPIIENIDSIIPSEDTCKMIKKNHEL